MWEMSWVTNDGKRLFIRINIRWKSYYHITQLIFNFSYKSIIFVIIFNMLSNHFFFYISKSFTNHTQIVRAKYQVYRKGSCSLLDH